MANNFQLFKTGGNGTQSGIGAAAPLQPNGDGIINIRDQYPWTLTPQNDLQETPYMHLQEYTVNQTQMSAMWETFTQFAEQGLTAGGGGTAADPYAGLYENISPTGFNYTFPYFNDSGFANNNSWTEVNAMSLGDIGGAATGVASGAFDIFKNMRMARGMSDRVFNRKYGKIGAGITLANAAGGALASAAVNLGMLKAASNNRRVKMVDKPMMWDNGTTRSFTVEFPLYNTIDVDKIQKNWEFCYLFTYQNLFNKLTYFTADPPVIYQIEIPGYHYSKAAYVSNLNISNKGNMRALDIDGVNGKIIIPDAFWVSITFTDLLVNSKNLFKLVGTGEGLNY
jgi:hypothetical protein